MAAKPAHHRRCDRRPVPQQPAVVGRKVIEAGSETDHDDGDKEQDVGQPLAPVDEGAPGRTAGEKRKAGQPGKHEQQVGQGVVTMRHTQTSMLVGELVVLRPLRDRRQLPCRCQHAGHDQRENENIWAPRHVTIRKTS